jgi:hypothetical protein
MSSSLGDVYQRLRGTAIFREQGQNIVAYLLKARTVAAEKQPLLGDGPYTRRIGTRHATIEMVLQAVFAVDPRLACCYATVK